MPSLSPLLHYTFIPHYVFFFFFFFFSFTETRAGWPERLLYGWMEEFGGGGGGGHVGTEHMTRTGSSLFS
jgi:hypothetical protein